MWLNVWDCITWWKLYEHGYNWEVGFMLGLRMKKYDLYLLLVFYFMEIILIEWVNFISLIEH